MNSIPSDRPAPLENSKGIVQLLVLIGFAFLFIGILGLIIAMLQLSGTVNLMDVADPDKYSNPNVLKWAKILQVLQDIALLILPVLALSTLVSRKKLEYLQLDRTGKITILLLGGVLMIAASPLINFLADLNSHLQLPSWLNGVETWMKKNEDLEDTVEAAFLTHQTLRDLLINLFMMGFVAAIAEELFFRGAMQKIFSKMTKSVHWGIWITAIIFSAIHVQFYGFLPRMLMGVYLGYLLYWSGSLWVPIFAHFLNNASAVFFSYLEERNIISSKIETIGTGSSGVWYVLGSTIIVTGLLVVMYRSSKTRTSAIPNS